LMHKVIQTQPTEPTILRDFALCKYFAPESFYAILFAGISQENFNRALIQEVKELYKQKLQNLEQHKCGAYDYISPSRIYVYSKQSGLVCEYKENAELQQYWEANIDLPIASKTNLSRMQFVGRNLEESEVTEKFREWKPVHQARNLGKILRLFAESKDRKTPTKRPKGLPVRRTVSAGGEPRSGYKEGSESKV
jgi:hypothetical protein